MRFQIQRSMGVSPMSDAFRHGRDARATNLSSSLRVFAVVFLLLTTTVSAAERKAPFILGADISWVPEDEAAGASYFDNGVQKDIFQILKDHGFNSIRLRVFVNPKSERGYARNMNETFCDLAHTKTMAKRIKAAGMSFLLDFHYSDNWADPGKQIKPAAWEGLTFPQLVQALHDHTKTVVAALKEQGTTPDMVQIGNEIRPGMVWPDGRVADGPSDNPLYDHWDNLVALINAGITAVHEVDPSIRIVLHNDRGWGLEKMRFWVDQLLARGVRFDVIAMSCYDQGKEGDWSRVFEDLAKRYPEHDLLVAEYSGRKRYVNDAIFNAPDRKGLGSYIWEPTRHKEAFFDQDGRNAGGGEPYDYASTRPMRRPTSAPASRAVVNPPRRRNYGGRYDTNALIDLYPQMARDYADK